MFESVSNSSISNLTSSWGDPGSRTTSKFFSDVVKPNVNHEKKKEQLQGEGLDTKKQPAQIASEAVNNLLPSAHVLPYTWTMYFHSRKTRSKEPEAAAEAITQTAQPAESTQTEQTELSAPASNPLQDPSKFVDSFLQTTKPIEFPEIYTKDAFNGLEKKTVTISCVEQLWQALLSVKHANELAPGSEIFVFKAGIEPVWEDKVNAKGGRWVFKFPRKMYNNREVTEEKARVSLVWERLVLRVLGGCFLPKSSIYNELFLNDISGLVLSVRRDEDVISVWNTNLSFDKRFQEQYFKSVSKTCPNVENPINGNWESESLVFNDRRMLCSSVLKVIRECDAILKGEDAAVEGNINSSERVHGISFEYRLNVDWDGKHDNHHHHHGHNQRGNYRGNGRRFKHKTESEENAANKLFEPGNFSSLGRSRRRRGNGDSAEETPNLMMLSSRRRMQMKEHVKN